MIITCNNCNKRFDIDSTLIPDEGRLLQCASCNHKWFFKKEVLEKKISPINEDTSIDNVNIFDQNNSSINDEESVSDAPNDEVQVDLEKETKEKDYRHLRENNDSCNGTFFEFTTRDLRQCSLIFKFHNENWKTEVVTRTKNRETPFQKSFT